jgi:transcriptional regulator with XRE-family HTH domain
MATLGSARPRSELAHFLKSLRGRVDPDVCVLGSRARLPSRLGKRVTQEELAEAIGVSREWYSMLESAAAVRTSTGLLDRLACALMVTPQERASLFQLAVPELGRARLRDDSAAVLEAFSRLRLLAKRLWGATCVQDVLTMASEDIATWFDGAVLIETSHRRDLGVWQSQAVDDKQDRNNASKVIKELEAALLRTPGEIDGMYLYPRLTSAGDTGTVDLLPDAVRREASKIYARRRLAGFTFVKARVRSRTGFIGGFCVVHELGHSYSASDRTVLGAFAELASLALS